MFRTSNYILVVTIYLKAGYWETWLWVVHVLPMIKLEKRYGCSWKGIIKESYKSWSVLMKIWISYSVIYFFNEFIQGHYFCILSSISLHLIAPCSVSAKLKMAKNLVTCRLATDEKKQHQKTIVELSVTIFCEMPQ